MGTNHSHFKYFVPKTYLKGLQANDFMLNMAYCILHVTIPHSTRRGGMIIVVIVATLPYHIIHLVLTIFPYHVIRLLSCHTCHVAYVPYLMVQLPHHVAHVTGLMEYLYFPYQTCCAFDSCTRQGGKVCRYPLSAYLRYRKA